MEKIVTRFAPSPTGFMHIGGVRTALFAWLLARQKNGTFILRIEDTDKEREVAGSIKHIMESLQWLGLEWDYGPDKPGPFGSCIQSERLESYLEAAHGLIAKGYAYPDPYTPEEIATLRANAQAEKRPFLFRDHRPATFGEWDGKRPLRFKVSQIKRYTWRDEVRGDLSAGEEALDDFILIKADGYPTYNFAHIIDDMHMGVTHIMRGDEFISSTPKFLSLYDALGIVQPKLISLPPILREDKTKKLGKRDGAKDILEYRTEGYLSEAMVNFLAFIGWQPGTDQELFRRDDLIREFDVSKIQTHGGIANEEKLDWFNREYIQNILTDEELYAYLEPAIRAGVGDRLAYSPAPVRALLPTLRTSVSLSSALQQSAAEGEYDYLFADPVLDAAKVSDKKSTPDQTANHLCTVLDKLTTISDFTDASIKAALWEYATEHGRGAVLWPLRYSLTGREKSPDPFIVASVIGRDATRARIQNALTLLGV